MNKSSGMTLVELLVAMVVGLILLGGVYVSFVSSTTTNSMNEQLSRMQENGRFAIDFLSHEIRQAGYLGCSGTKEPIPNLSSSHAGSLPAVAPVRGWVAGAAGAPEPDAIAGTDILQIGGAGSNSSYPVLNIQAAPTIIEIGNASQHDLQVGEILLLSDCNSSIWFGACNITTQQNSPPKLILSADCGNLSPGQNFIPDEVIEGEILRFRSATYFLGYRNNNPLNPPSLFVRRGAGTAQEVVEGIESLKILYGEDTSRNGAADEYQTADTVVNWANVVSVRIGLLLRSPDELLRGETDESEEYIVNGISIPGPGDRRLRMVMSTTAGIRNRLR